MTELRIVRFSYRSNRARRHENQMKRGIYYKKTSESEMESMKMIRENVPRQI